HHQATLLRICRRLHIFQPHIHSLCRLSNDLHIDPHSRTSWCPFRVSCRSSNHHNTKSHQVAVLSRCHSSCRLSTRHHNSIPSAWSICLALRVFRGGVQVRLVAQIKEKQHTFHCGTRPRKAIRLSSRCLFREAIQPRSSRPRTAVQ